MFGNQKRRIGCGGVQASWRSHRGQWHSNSHVLLAQTSSMPVNALTCLNSIISVSSFSNRSYKNTDRMEET